MPAVSNDANRGLFFLAKINTDKNPKKHFLNPWLLWYNKRDKIKLKIMPAEPIDQFVDNLIKQAGINNLPEDYLVVYKEKVKEQINRRLALMLMENVNDKSAKEISDLFADPENLDLSQAQEIFSKHVSELEEKVAAEMLAFAEDFVKAAKS